jgi:TPR repeat protein
MAGNVDAMAIMGLIYGSGTGGLPKDERQALNWFERAAIKGQPFAIRTMAQVYAKGLFGEAPSPEKASYWKQQADKLPPAQVQQPLLFRPGTIR